MEKTEIVTNKPKRYLSECQRKGYRLTPEVMQLLKISPEYAKKFYISDIDLKNNLVQIHYADDIKELWEEYIKASENPENFKTYPLYFPRGFVIDMKKRRIVCRSFEYTPEIIQKPETFKSFIEGFSKQQDIPWKFFEMKEGTIIRAFTHNGILRFSTHRRLNCNNSKWGSDLTFLEMLHEAATTIGFDLNKLKTPSKEFAKCHVLLLIHQQNQCINQNLVEPMIYHLASWVITARPKDGSLAPMAYIEVDFGLPRPKKLSIDEAYKCFTAGSGVITANQENCIKLIPESLHEKIQIRGFDYNIKHRWYELCDENKQFLLKEIVPLHLKKQIDGFEDEKKIDVINLTFFLSNIFLYELHGNWEHGIFHSKLHHNLIETIWTQLATDRVIFYKSGGKGKFYWGNTPKETRQKIFDAFFKLLNTLSGAILYTAIIKYKKQLKLHEKKLHTIRFCDLPHKVVHSKNLNSTKNVPNSQLNID